MHRLSDETPPPVIHCRILPLIQQPFGQISQSLHLAFARVPRRIEHPYSAGIRTPSGTIDTSVEQITGYLRTSGLNIFTHFASFYNFDDQCRSMNAGR